MQSATCWIQRQQCPFDSALAVLLFMRMQLFLRLERNGDVSHKHGSSFLPLHNPSHEASALWRSVVVHAALALPPPTTS